MFLANRHELVRDFPLSDEICFWNADQNPEKFALTVGTSSRNSFSRQKKVFPRKEESRRTAIPTAPIAGLVLDAMLETKEQLEIVVLPPSLKAPPTSGRTTARIKYSTSQGYIHGE